MICHERRSQENLEMGRCGEGDSTQPLGGGIWLTFSIKVAAVRFLIAAGQILYLKRAGK